MKPARGRPGWPPARGGGGEWVLEQRPSALRGSLCLHGVDGRHHGRQSGEGDCRPLSSLAQEEFRGDPNAIQIGLVRVSRTLKSPAL